MANASPSKGDAREELAGSSPVRPTKVKVTLHLTEEAATILARHATERGRGQFVSQLIVEKETATMEAASKQSAKLSSAGSTPAVASYPVPVFVGSKEMMEMFIDCFPCWFIQASGETATAAGLNPADPEGLEGSTPSWSTQQ